MAAVVGAGAGVVRAAVTRLLVNAQRVGAVRDDVGCPEVMALLVAVSRGAGLPGADPGVRARALTVVMDGLRPRADLRRPLAAPRPPLSGPRRIRRAFGDGGDPGNS